MTDVKTLNREDTIRALRACGTYGGTCSECPLNEPAQELSFDCVNELLRHAADVLESSVSV